MSRPRGASRRRKGSAGAGRGLIARAYQRRPIVCGGRAATAHRCLRGWTTTPARQSTAAEVVPTLFHRVLSPRILISPRLSRSLENNIIPCQRFIVYVQLGRSGYDTGAFSALSRSPVHHSRKASMQQHPEVSGSPNPWSSLPKHRRRAQPAWLSSAPRPPARKRSDSPRPPKRRLSPLSSGCAPPPTPQVAPAAEAQPLTIDQSWAKVCQSSVQLTRRCSESRKPNTSA